MTEVFETPEELIEHHGRGNFVDHRMLQHAFNDLPRPTPEEAKALQDAGETPRIGFAFDSPEDVLAFAKLGGRVNEETVKAMEEGVAQGREFALGEPALIGAWYLEDGPPS